MFSNYLRPNISFTQMFKKADKFDFYSTDHYSYTLKACAKLNENPNIIVAQTCFDLENYIRDLHDEKDIDFSDVVGGFYNERMELLDDFIESIISEHMSLGKIIIIFCDFENYSIDIDNKNEGDHHSTCLIFHPTDNNNYDAFYINSHGHEILDDTFYDLRISRSRTRRYQFEKAVNLIFIDSFIYYMQNFHKKCKIFYDDDIMHNYLGSNLQIGDNYGICFAFPLVIALYIINYYETERVMFATTGGVYVKRKLTLPPVKKMLYDRNLTKFVPICFIDFSEHLKNSVIRSLIPPYMQRYYKNKYKIEEDEKENIRKQITEFCEIKSYTLDFIADYERTIEGEEDKFVKVMLNALISFLTHKDITKIIQK